MATMMLLLNRLFSMKTYLKHCQSNTLSLLFALYKIKNVDRRRRLKLQKTGQLFSRVLRESTPRYVGPSVGLSPFYFFGVL